MNAKLVIKHDYRPDFVPKRANPYPNDKIIKRKRQISYYATKNTRAASSYSNSFSFSPQYLPGIIMTASLNYLTLLSGW
jgi:hypothetical protein